MKIYFRKPALVLVVGLFLVLTGGAVLSSSGTAYADPPDVQSLQDYCKKKVDAKAEEGCSAKNIDDIQAVASKKCRDSKGNELITCVQKASQGIIDQVAAEKPKNATDFNKALDDVIKKAGGVPSQNFPDPSGETADPNTNCDPDAGCDLVKKYVNPLIKVLSITVGLVAAASLIVGGIQYSAGSGDAQKTSAAKRRISQTLVALFAYAFLYSFLNFLIPGGIFG